MSRINRRVGLEIRMQAALHGIKMEGIVEEAETTPLSDNQKKVLEKRMREAQERIRAKWQAKKN